MTENIQTKTKEGEVAGQEEKGNFLLYFALNKKVGVVGSAGVMQLMRLFMAIADTDIDPKAFVQLSNITADNVVTLFNMVNKENFTKEELLALTEQRGKLPV